MATIRPVSAPLDRPVRLAVLISGGGTTLENLIEKIEQGELEAEISLVVASQAECGGVDKAKNAELPFEVVPRRQYGSAEEFSSAIFDHCRAANVDLVVLAGFLSLIHVPDDFNCRVMNIHPALIPSFCGQGFFGHRVHEAVLDRGVKVTGCTVHFADNEYDHGPIILQKPVPVEEGDTPETLAARVFEAEREAYPEAIRLYASGCLEITNRRLRILND